MSTVPCAYKVGKTLGQGTYAVVKEAVHIKTGEYFACKVISKRLMEGREHMVRNEIAALKKVSQVSMIWHAEMPSLRERQGVIGDVSAEIKCLTTRDIGL
jgi:serine/threonine protein kinase